MDVPCPRYDRHRSQIQLDLFLLYLVAVAHFRGNFAEEFIEPYCLLLFRGLFVVAKARRFKELIDELIESFDIGEHRM